MEARWAEGAAAAWDERRGKLHTSKVRRRGSQDLHRRHGWGGRAAAERELELSPGKKSGHKSKCAHTHYLSVYMGGGALFISGDEELENCASALALSLP